MPTWIEKPEEYDHTKSLAANKCRDRGTVRCPCGDGVNLGNAVYGPRYAAQCDSCGQLFNLSGQELVPECQWEEEDRY